MSLRKKYREWRNGRWALTGFRWLINGAHRFMMDPEVRDSEYDFILEDPFWNNGEGMYIILRRGSHGEPNNKPTK